MQRISKKKRDKAFQKVTKSTKKEIPSLHAALKLGNPSETRRNTLKILERIKDEENKEFVWTEKCA